MIKRKKQSVFPLLLSLILYRLTLGLVFQQVLLNSLRTSYPQVSFSYHAVHAIISWLLLFATVPVFLKFRWVDRLSDSVVEIFFLIAFIPGTVCYSYTDMPFFPLWLAFFAFLALCNLFHFRTVHIVSIKINRHFIYFLTLLCVLFVVCLWARFAHFRIVTNLVEGIYEIRGESNGYRSQLPKVLEYLFDMIRMLFPILMIYFAHMKKWILMALFGFGELLTFFIDGGKFSLFVLLAVFAAYVVIILKQYRSILLVTVGLSLLNVAAIAEWAAVQSTNIANLLVHRVLILPNMLHYLYYDYFTKHAIDLYRDGFLSHFGVPPLYGTPIAKVIGKEYFGYYYQNLPVNANNGLFSDAYANLGIAGVFLMPIFIVLTLKLCDRVCGKHGNHIRVACMVLLSIKLVSDSVFTNLLAGGILLTMTVLFLLPPQNKYLNPLNSRLQYCYNRL